MTAVLEIVELNAGYGGVPVVRDVSLTVHSGEVVALLGANGAGKTTMLLTAATVRENLRLGGAPDLEPALALFPALRPLQGRRCGLLSGGEQQMLGLAKALLARPRVLLVDELSLGLAPVIVQRLLPTLRQLALERDIGVLLVEQHTQMALSVAHRAYVMRRGKIVLEGEATELRARQDLLEASYLTEEIGGRA